MRGVDQHPGHHGHLQRWLRWPAAAALALGGLSPSAVAPPAAYPAGSGVCAGAVRTITYNVSAIQLVLPVNGWGDHIPDGMMYVLNNGTSLTLEQARAARAAGHPNEAFPNKAAVLNNPNLASPLVIRAAVGDCITINFTNEISIANEPGLSRIGMHADLGYDPKDSDGARVGNNPDTAVPTSGTITYTWFASREGQWPINDFGSGTQFKMPQLDAAGNIIQGPDGKPLERVDTTSRGLYGAVVVGPPGSTWHDIRTGDNMLGPTNVAVETQVQADFHVPGLNPDGSPNDFRDFVAVFMDEPENVKDRDGKQPTFPATGLQDSTFGLNYRSEPLRNRMRAWLEHNGAARHALGSGPFPTPVISGFEPGPAIDALNITALPPLWAKRGATLSGGKIQLPAGTVVFPNGTLVAKDDHFCDGYTVDLGRVVDDPNAVCYGEETHLQSWAFGDMNKLTHVVERDPQTLQPSQVVVDTDNTITKAYRKDPIRFRLVHPGIKETHTWHQHTMRWFHDPKNDKSARLDVQSTGPGQSFELNMEGGAGNIQGTVGDQVFHCHLYPHFAQGFWGTHRILDRLRLAAPFTPGAILSGAEGQPLSQVYDETGTLENALYEDGTPIEPLQPLPDRLNPVQMKDPNTGQMQTFDPTPAPDATHPGFPLWVKGEYLQRAYRAPGTITNDPFQFGKKVIVGGLPKFQPDSTRTTYFRRPGDSVRVSKTSKFVTPLEAANFVDRGDGTFTPGVAFVDPCPTGTPLRFYFPAAIDANIIYNRAGWRDPNGKLYVEAPPAGATTGQNVFPTDWDNTTAALDAANTVRNGINAGTITPEPYTIRSRLGECVNLRTTDAAYLDNDPAWPLDIHGGQSGDIFHEPTPMTEITTHVHIVRFDQEGTDGTSVGWNYVQGPLNGQTYGYRWFVDVPLRTVFFHDHQNPNTHQQHGMWSAMNVEPADATWTKPDGSFHSGVGTVANILSPTGTSFREFTVHYSDFVPQVDAAGKPINPPQHPDDFGADQGVMAINYKNEPFPIRINSATIAAGGQKAEPAYVFSSAVHGDPSTPVFRAYPNDPVVFRFMDGAHEEEHNFTLSGHRWLHEPDDPNSNLYDAQAMNIAEWFNFEVDGARVASMGDLRQAKENMREEAEEHFGATKVLTHGAGAPGDYLYGSQPLNDLWMGMWGIFRVYAAQSNDVKPLPNNPAPSASSQWPALKPGDALRGPTSAQNISTPCVTPNGVPVAPNKFFFVSLIKQDIVYNPTTGYHDPNGVMYTLTENLANPWALWQPGVLKAGMPAKPLFLRANQGDCVMVTLTNRLPTTGIGPDYAQNGDPINPVENVGVFNLVGGTLQGNKLVGGTVQQVQAIHPAGNRAGIHMGGLARYNVSWNDGAAVGYNFDSTIAPGGAYVYLFYVDTKDMGVVGFQNLANVRNTRHHGAWGALVAEPTGASYLDPTSLAPIKSGEAAVIKYPVTNPDGTITNKSFREFVIDFQDGLNLFTSAGTRVIDLVKGDVPGAAPDPEDQGEKGVNYRSEPFLPRLQRDPAHDIANVFSSAVHGDPTTPVFRAYVGDPVMVRALNSQDLPRTHSISVFGHEWPHEVLAANSPIINTQGGFDTSREFNLNMGVFGPNTGGAPLVKGAGGPGQRPGDYLYLDRNFFFQLSGGLWGIVRVLDPAAPASDLPRLP